MLDLNVAFFFLSFFKMNGCVGFCRSCAELLLLLPQHVPGALWEEFQSSMKVSIPGAVKRSLRFIFAVIKKKKRENLV